VRKFQVAKKIIFADSLKNMEAEIDEIEYAAEFLHIHAK